MAARKTVKLPTWQEVTASLTGASPQVVRSDREYVSIVYAYGVLIDRKQYEGVAKLIAKVLSSKTEGK